MVPFGLNAQSPQSCLTLCDPMDCNVTYVFKSKSGNKIGEYLNKTPATLSSQSNVARQFKQIVNPKGDMNPKIVNNQIPMKILIAIIKVKMF